MFDTIIEIQSEMRKYLLVLICFVLCLGALNSQRHNCEVDYPDVYEYFQIPNLEQYRSIQSSGWSVSTPYGGACPTNTCAGGAGFDCCIANPCRDFRIPVVVTLLRDAACGNHSLTEAQINTFFTKVNDFYSCLNVPFSFYHATDWDDSAIDYMGNNTSVLSNGARVLCNDDLNLFYRSSSNDMPPNDPAGNGTDDFVEARAFNIPGVMNIYIPGDYNGFTPGTTCPTCHEGGVASYPTSNISSFGTAFGINGFNNTSDDCATGTDVVYHEFGHWFGLHHTHGPVNNAQVNAGDPNGNDWVECPDGSECCTLGDFICDTDPDPNLSTGSVTDSNGNPLPSSCVTGSSGSINVSSCHSTCGTSYSNATNAQFNMMSYVGQSGPLGLTDCQKAKMVDALLCARGPMLCNRNAADDLVGGAMAASAEICVGDAAPTFTASYACAEWYDGTGAGATSVSGTSSFTPTIGTGAGQLNNAMPGVYSWYLGEDDETNPDCRTQVTVTVHPNPGNPTINGAQIATFCEAESMTLTTDVSTLLENQVIGWWITDDPLLGIADQTTLNNAINGATIGGPLTYPPNHLIRATGGDPAATLSQTFDCSGLEGNTYYATPMISSYSAGAAATNCSVSGSTSSINVNFGGGDLREGGITGSLDLNTSGCPTNQGDPTINICLDFDTYTNGSGNIGINFRTDGCSSFISSNGLSGVNQGDQVCFTSLDLNGFNPFVDDLCLLIWENTPNSSSNSPMTELQVELTITASYDPLPAIPFPSANYTDCMFGAFVQISCECECPGNPDFTLPISSREVCGSGVVTLNANAPCDQVSGSVGEGNAMDVYMYAPGGSPAMAPTNFEMSIDLSRPTESQVTTRGFTGTVSCPGDSEQMTCKNPTLQPIAFDFTCGTPPSFMTPVNNTCEPIDITYFTVLFDYNRDFDGDGVTEYSPFCSIERFDLTVYPDPSDFNVNIVNPECDGADGSVTISAANGEVCFTASGTAGTTATNTNATLSYDQTFFAGTSCEEQFMNDIEITCSVVLPLEIASFKAVRLNKDVELIWEVHKEQNVELYIIERSSDGQVFEYIGETPATDSQALRKSYHWIDKQALSEAYYRLKVLSYDGSMNFSEVIRLGDLENPNTLKVFPNPTANLINVSGENLIDYDSWVLTDGHGKSILKGAIDMNQLNLLVIKDLEMLHDGIYFLQLVGDKGTWTRKILKIR